MGNNPNNPNNQRGTTSTTDRNAKPKDDANCGCSGDSADASTPTGMKEETRSKGTMPSSSGNQPGDNKPGDNKWNNQPSRDPQPGQNAGAAKTGASSSTTEPKRNNSTEIDPPGAGNETDRKKAYGPGGGKPVDSTDDEDADADDNERTRVGTQHANAQNDASKEKVGTTAGSTGKNDPRRPKN